MSSAAQAMNPTATRPCHPAVTARVVRRIRGTTPLALAPTLVQLNNSACRPRAVILSQAKDPPGNTGEHWGILRSAQDDNVFIVHGLVVACRALGSRMRRAVRGNAKACKVSDIER